MFAVYSPLKQLYYYFVLSHRAYFELTVNGSELFVWGALLSVKIHPLATLFEIAASKQTVQQCQCVVFAAKMYTSN